MDKCKWTIRPGTAGALFAYTPCKPGFNYLSKVKKVENIKLVYENKECPICGKSIECDTKYFDI